ncbi:hypothetical protein ACFLVW_03370 [Chloroflexota bacterium]
MSRQNDLDNHSNQMNPNNDAYWESRGYDERPDDWEEIAEEDTEDPKGTFPTLYKQ